LAVSPSGQFLASGQLGTRSYKGAAAPIFIWNVETGHRLVALRGKVIIQLTLFKFLSFPLGLTQKVNLLEFSTDEKFLCGCGEVG
jgi:hypothetical protein